MWINSYGTIFFELSSYTSRTTIRIKSASEANDHRRIFSLALCTSVSAVASAIVRQQTNAVVKRLADALAHVAQQLPHSIVVGITPARGRAD